MDSSTYCLLKNHETRFVMKQAVPSPSASRAKNPWISVLGPQTILHDEIGTVGDAVALDVMLLRDFGNGLQNSINVVSPSFKDE